MKAMLKNKFICLAILSLSVMLSGAACTSHTEKDQMMKKDGMKEEGSKMKEDTMMMKDDNMKEDGMMMEDGMMK